MNSGITRPLLVTIIVCVACAQSASNIRPDSTALAEAVARTINADGLEENAHGHSAIRASGGATPWDSLVAKILRTRYGAKFIPDDDSVYVRRIATSGLAFRGDTASVWVISAICVHARPSDAYAWRATAAQYHFAPQHPAQGDTAQQWRRLAEGDMAVVDGECTEAAWPDGWWEMSRQPANDR